jgi:hypothetical protein
LPIASAAVVVAALAVPVAVVVFISVVIPIRMALAAPRPSGVKPFQIIGNLTAVLTAPRRIPVYVGLSFRHAIATRVVVSPVGASWNCTASHEQQTPSHRPREKRTGKKVLMHH